MLPSPPSSPSLRSLVFTVTPMAHISRDTAFSTMSNTPSWASHYGVAIQHFAVVVGLLFANISFVEFSDITVIQPYLALRIQDFADLERRFSISVSSLVLVQAWARMRGRLMRAMTLQYVFL
ncbi:hypothetical protein SCHPADRAFT_934164 [Schizopora paradoxa]|uniref:Uncharacterized protein n=1 Tax=Schizopora paradoxa TaxID=27342 RepID=A0A0H2RFX2_9AGAM|nr:hypothetical protein SCHPADRAFT_934164 [Schizopora paradoxa]